TLAALSLTAAAALPASAQITGGSITTNSQGTFNLAEAYPCTAGTYAASLGVTDPQVFDGTCPTPAGFPGATPGDLCLSRSGNNLNVNCFVVIPAGQTGPCFVQAYRLTKQVPGSFKCPDVYGLPHFDGNGKLVPYQYFQFGNGVRTWWALNFTQPGTQFILEVVSVCRAAPVVELDKNGVPVVDPNTKQEIILSPGGQAQLHKDVWTWRVVADANTLGYVINLFHEGAVGTLEVPCIIGEDMYDALVRAQTKLAQAIAGGNQGGIGDQIFNMEALIVSNCLFTEVLNPLTFFKGPDQQGAANIMLPGNAAPTVTFPNGGATAVAGVIDTIEHPCCCKLLVDLEWIAIRNGLIGQSPT
ncbi:MAG: hypothetical protein ACRDU0_18535, partial [Mycobacterium sp.]